MNFTKALELLKMSMANEVKPEFSDEEVPEVSAAYCILYNDLKHFPERQKLLERLCYYPNFPKYMIRCQYSHEVLFENATQIEPDLEFFYGCKAADNVENTGKDWHEEIANLKNEKPSREIL